MFETIKPMDIEKRSFQIITETLGDRVLDPENELVIKRVIHTTADFDYADNLRFSEHAVKRGIEALRGGCGIVTDTQMAKAGINKMVLARLGGRSTVSCPTRMWRRRPGTGASPAPWFPWSGRRRWGGPVSSPLATPPRR